jgi:nucleotide-binding universal stress UspA family protein
MKYKHILYPTDGSKESLKALTHVKQIAKIFESEVTVLCVYKLPYSMNNNFISMPAEIYNQYKLDNQKQAKKTVDEIVAELNNSKIDAESIVVEGNPKTMICEHAKKLGCDLIIMGTRGHSELNYIGSTSTYVINHVDNCPVMVVS